jgi:hypothetical protein
MGKIADATFTGRSKKNYDFAVYAWGTEFKALGAVYVITQRTVTDNKGIHKVIYFGQTGDLSERFDNHHKASCFKKNGVNCICILLESNEKTRLAIESDLIDGNDTLCND